MNNLIVNITVEQGTKYWWFELHGVDGKRFWSKWICCMVRIYALWLAWMLYLHLSCLGYLLMAFFQWGIAIGHKIHHNLEFTSGKPFGQIQQCLLISLDDPPEYKDRFFWIHHIIDALYWDKGRILSMKKCCSLKVNDCLCLLGD